MNSQTNKQLSKSVVKEVLKKYGFNLKTNEGIKCLLYECCIKEKLYKTHIVNQVCYAVQDSLKINFDNDIDIKTRYKVSRLFDDLVKANIFEYIANQPVIICGKYITDLMKRQVSAESLSYPWNDTSYPWHLIPRKPYGHRKLLTQPTQYKMYYENFNEGATYQEIDFCKTPGAKSLQYEVDDTIYIEKISNKRRIAIEFNFKLDDGITVHLNSKKQRVHKVLNGINPEEG